MMRWCSNACRHPAIRAYALAERYRRREQPIDDEAREILFGQTAAVVRQRRGG
jgi:hypothetical protein